MPAAKGRHADRRRPAEAIGPEEARRLYLETQTPVRAIADALHVSEPTFRALRRELGWPVRPSLARGARGPRNRGRPPAAAGLVPRLRRQIGRRLDEVEAADQAASAAECAALLKALAELARLEAGAGAARDRAAPEDAHAGPLGAPGAADPDALRQEIARRVEGFGAGRAPHPLPGDAEPG